MSNEEKQQYSREYKAKVVLEATSEDADPVEVARRHNVTPGTLLSWANQMDVNDLQLKKLAEAAGTEGAHDAIETVDVDSNSDRFAASIEYGATHDILDMKKLTFWSLFGTGFVLLIILALYGAYTLTTSQTIQQVYEQGGDHYEVRELHERQRADLESFGVVDAEEEIYRVPIDSVFSRMVREAE